MINLGLQCFWEMQPRTLLSVDVDIVIIIDFGVNSLLKWLLKLAVNTLHS